MTLILVGGVCLWVGIALGWVAGINMRRGETVGRKRDTSAVMPAFKEWQETGDISPETRRWLETGVRPR